MKQDEPHQSKSPDRSGPLKSGVNYPQSYSNSNSFIQKSPYTNTTTSQSKVDYNGSSSRRPKTGEKQVLKDNSNSSKNAKIFNNPTSGGNNVNSANHHKRVKSQGKVFIFLNSLVINQPGGHFANY